MRCGSSEAEGEEGAETAEQQTMAASSAQGAAATHLTCGLYSAIDLHYSVGQK